MYFTPSLPFTLGVELELQLIDPTTSGLKANAKQILRSMRHVAKHETYAWKLQPEITQGMIEINSSIHEKVGSLQSELAFIQQQLKHITHQYGCNIAGGGTHPFHSWSKGKIFPKPRYLGIYKHYGYLAKRFTVFGQHIHIGCQNADDAVYLTHALARFMPHFIALSAASPFYQGVDTFFDSARIPVVNAFPVSGLIPYHLSSWRDFSDYFNKLRGLGIIKSIKDCYWDIRPKAEFGTVEIRICDTPLNIEIAALLAAYAQALCAYLLKDRPIDISEDYYLVYPHNRFQASRYGYNATLIEASSRQTYLLKDDLLWHLTLLEPYFKVFGTLNEAGSLTDLVNQEMNGSRVLRAHYESSQSLAEVVKHATLIWEK